MKYSLVGVDGNALSIIAYTKKAMYAEGMRDQVDEMMNEAMKGSYYELIAVCDSYLDKANEKAVDNGYEEEDEEW